MTISKSRGNPTRYKVVVGGWTLIVQRSSLSGVKDADRKRYKNLPDL